MKYLCSRKIGNNGNNVEKNCQIQLSLSYLVMLFYSSDLKAERIRLRGSHSVRGLWKTLWPDRSSAPH